jgi:hypothetical protein|tara:strand:- start:114 stop:287 length:174 start_codon:yes stop_codon:yes gene_type:complete
MDWELEKRLDKLEDWTLDLIVRSREENEHLLIENGKLKKKILILKERIGELECRGSI